MLRAAFASNECECARSASIPPCSALWDSCAFRLPGIALYSCAVSLFLRGSGTVDIVPKPGTLLDLDTWEMLLRIPSQT